MSIWTRARYGRQTSQNLELYFEAGSEPRSGSTRVRARISEVLAHSDRIKALDDGL